MNPRTIPFLLALLLTVPLGVAQASDGFVVFTANMNDTIQYGYDYETRTEFYPEGSYNSVNMNGDGNTPAILAVDLDGKRAYSVDYECVAVSDGATSVFYAVFTTTDVAVGSSSAGNAATSGAFANSIRARLEEDGNTWQLSIWNVVAGESTMLANHTLSVNPNSYQQFRFHVDLIEGTAAILDGVGNVLLDTTEVDPDLLDGEIHGQWFVAKSPSFVNAQTRCKLNAPSLQVRDQDPIPPEIAGVSWNPDVVAAGQSIAVTATVTDDHGTPDVTLYYTLNSGVARLVPMSSTSQTTFTGTIPGQANDVTIRFWIVATDTEGLESQSDTYRVVVGSGAGVEQLAGGSNGGGGGGLEGAKDVVTSIVYALLIMTAGVLVFVLTKRAQLRGLRIFGAALFGVLVMVAIAFPFLYWYSGEISAFFVTTAGSITLGLLIAGTVGVLAYFLVQAYLRRS